MGEAMNHRILILYIAAVLLGCRLNAAYEVRKTFPLGIFGGKGQVVSGELGMTMSALTSGGPLEQAGIQIGDKIVGIGGRSFDVSSNDISQKGFHVLKAMGMNLEYNGSKIIDLNILRNSVPLTISVTLPDIRNVFGAEYPLNCDKSKMIYEKSCSNFANVLSSNRFGGDKKGLVYSLGAMLLMTSEKSEYFSLIQSYKRYAIDNYGPNSGVFGIDDLILFKDSPLLRSKDGPRNWSVTTIGFFLCEYYLATGDESVLPTIAHLCKVLELRSYKGRFGHHAVISYGGQGLNAVTVRAYLFFNMCKKVGVAVDRTVWNEVRAHMQKSSAQYNAGIGYYSSGKLVEIFYRTGTFLAGQFIGDYQNEQNTSNATAALSNPLAYGKALTGHGFIVPGLFWGSNALYIGNRDAFHNYMKDHRWYYNLAHIGSGNVVFAGSWKTAIGDTQLNAHVMNNVIMGLVFSNDKQKLFIQGNRARNWYNPFGVTFTQTGNKLEVSIADENAVSQLSLIDNKNGNVLNTKKVDGSGRYNFTISNHQNVRLKVDYTTGSGLYKVDQLQDMVTTPSLTGLTQPVAESTLTNHNLGLYKINEVPSFTHKPGTVIDQLPKTGEAVARGEKVSLWIAKAPIGETLMFIEDSFGNSDEVIARVSHYSAEGDLNLTYSISSGNENRAFVINPVNGEIKSGVNFSQPGFYPITVTVGSKVGKSSQKLMIIAGIPATLKSEKWTNVLTTPIPENTFDESADETSSLTEFSSLVNSSDNYVQRLSGYFVAPSTGSYTFWVAADDTATLYLSTTGIDNNKVKIASTSGATNFREWDKYPLQKSKPVFLKFGQICYLEAVHQELSGRDHLDVAWKIPGGTREVISGRPLLGLELDSDQDTLHDVWELQNFNTLNKSASHIPDDDNDGLNNFLEEYYGIVGKGVDSDNDGFMDGFEHTYGTNPNDNSSLPLTDNLLISGDFQGDGSSSYQTQLNSAVTMAGIENSLSNLGGHWNALEFSNINSNPSTQFSVNSTFNNLQESNGITTNIDLSLYGSVAGWSGINSSVSGNAALINDYLVLKKYGSDSKINFKFSNLVPGASYDFYCYGKGDSYDVNIETDKQLIVVGASGGKLSGIKPDKNGELSGTVTANGSASEGRWAGFQLKGIRTLAASVVPSLKGHTQASATALLKSLNLIVGKVTYSYDELIPAGKICKQGANLKKLVPHGTSIDFSISKGTSLPTNLKTTLSGDQNVATISWNGVVNATGYKVILCSDVSLSNVLVSKELPAKVLNVTFSSSELSPLTQYFYGVRAVADDISTTDYASLPFSGSQATGALYNFGKTGKSSYLGHRLWNVSRQKITHISTKGTEASEVNIGIVGSKTPIGRNVAFEDLTGNKASLAAGQSFDMTVSLWDSRDYGWNAGILWIDWNNDGDFDDTVDGVSEKVQEINPGSWNKSDGNQLVLTKTFTVNVPQNLPIHSTGRIRLRSFLNNNRVPADSYGLQYSIHPSRSGQTVDLSYEITKGLSVNHAPDAVDDFIYVEKDREVTVKVLDNDIDADGDALQIMAVTQGLKGTVITNGTTITYTPAGLFTGKDTFTYTISDGKLTDTATVTVKTPLSPTRFTVVQTGTVVEWSAEQEQGVKLYRLVDTVTRQTVATILADGSITYKVTVKKGTKVELVVLNSDGFEQYFMPENGRLIVNEYHLVKGWNLIAVVGDKANLNGLRKMICGPLWAWDGHKYVWVKGDPQAGCGLWVYARAEETVNVTARRSSAKVMLNTGWNLMGPLNNISVPEKVDAVYSWNTVYENVLESHSTLYKGVGYWFFVSEPVGVELK